MQLITQLLITQGLLFQVNKTVPVFDYKPVPVVVEAPAPEPIVYAPAVQTPVRQPVNSSEIASIVRGVGGESLVVLLTHESGLNPYAVNPSSGACGLFQKLPCNVPLGNVQAQLVDGMNYINGRYGSSDNALAFWYSHNWY